MLPADTIRPVFDSPAFKVAVRDCRTGTIPGATDIGATDIVVDHRPPDAGIRIHVSDCAIAAR